MLELVIRNGASSTLRDQSGVEAVTNGLIFRSREFADRKTAYPAELGRR
jgi:hypothetical protein